MRRLITLVVLLGLSGLPASAAVQQELVDLQSRYRDERVRALRLRADAADARAEIAALDRRLAGLTRDQAADDQELAAQRRRLRDLSAREAALVAELSESRDAQGRLLSALQTLSRRPPPPLLIPADRAVDTVRATVLLRAVAPELQRRASVLEARRAEVARIRRLALLSSERLVTTESAAVDRRAAMEDLSARRTALLAVITADAVRAERAAEALESRIRALGGRPAMPSEAEVSAPAARLPAGRTRLTAPVPGVPASRFGGGASGWRWTGIQGPVAAPAQSRVDHAGPLSGWGQVVILDLGPGWRAVIAGLDTLAVEPGQRVADGQTLGQASGGEVYFELRREERPIDPGPYLR